MLQAAINTIQKVIPQRIDTAREAVTLGTKDAHPDYKAITSTVKDALDELSQYEGKIVEQGRHEELVERRGMYYELVQKQLSAA